MRTGAERLRLRRGFRNDWCCASVALLKLTPPSRQRAMRVPHEVENAKALEERVTWRGTPEPNAEQDATRARTPAISHLEFQ